MATPTANPRQTEMILREIHALPTLPVVATRLLQLTADSEARTREVVEVVASDPTLTAKVLSLCRSADRGVRQDVLTIDRAVVLLGFNAIRNAVLSVKVLEVFAQAGRRNRRKASGDEPPSPFNHTEFWRHSLGVAVTAELVARKHGRPAELAPDEAFVAGLLHDIGKLALDHVLPRAFARVVELTDLNQVNIAEVERRVIGMDHHTAGKRLAEQWGLPHVLQDCIWLHGAPASALPAVPHRRMIQLIGLADLVTRRHHVGYSGNHALRGDEAALAASIGVDPACIDHAIERLHEELERRGGLLGLDDRPSRELFLKSIQRANEQLGRLNAALERRGAVASTQQKVIDAIRGFHAMAAPSPGMLPTDVLERVVTSAVSVLGPGFYATLSPAPAANADSSADGTVEPWCITCYDPQGQPRRTQTLRPPRGATPLSHIDAGDPTALHVMSILPWVADYLLDMDDLRQVRLLPLPCGWGAAALLLHDRPTLPPWPTLSALVATWGSAVAAAIQHDGARRLGEQLAEANRALADTQDRLLQAQSMARLGEMAAGAAHEMNNPLAVISGRSQLLAMALPANTPEQKAAQQVYEQAHRLSDLITSLRLIADPPKAQRKPMDLHAVLDDAIRRARAAAAKTANLPPITLSVKDALPALALDAAMIGGAVAELVSNALAAAPRRFVQVQVQCDSRLAELVIAVRDDGLGMDEHTLTHAMDPFFSAKAAGRRMGMGLPRAKQWVAAHGGQIELRSKPDVGTVATIRIPLTSENLVDATPDRSRRRVARSEPEPATAA